MTISLCYSYLAKHNVSVCLFVGRHTRFAQQNSTQYGWQRQSLCRYLFFYSETLELLLRSGVLSPDQTGLSVVSEAISGLWSSLPPKRRAEAQKQALQQSSVSWKGQTEITTSPITSLYPSVSHVVEEVRSNSANLGLFWKPFVLSFHFHFPSSVTNSYWWPSVSLCSFKPLSPDFL